MLKSFFGAKQWALWSWGGLLILMGLVIFQVEMTVELNKWYEAFYNILQTAKDEKAFWQKMVEFLYIAIPYIFAAIASSYFAKHYAFRWRQAITFYYLPYWSSHPTNIEGASQRIQEDTYQFANALESLGLGLFRSVLTLIAFIPILWMLSSKITIPWLAQIPGSLVWIAMLTSFGAMIISFLVGIKLPGLEYTNQKVEATYRKHLVYSEDDKSYANLPVMADLFLGLRPNYFRLFNHYTYFSLWSNIYAQLMIILPYLMMAPSLFSGVITLGVITQTGNAFGRVNEGFGFFIDRWTDITKFLSVIKRLREFESHLIHQHPDPQSIPKYY